MKKFFLSGALILLIAGCTASRSTGGNDYGYTFDMPLPVVSGTQAQLTAAMNAPSSGYATTESGGQTHGPASQSVVFYEGSQPTQGTVAAGTPVWTSPVAPAPAPSYVPGTGAPVVNEPAGAAVGANAAGAPMAAEAPAPYYYGDGGSAFIAGTNGVTNGGGINISNSNVIGFPTNGLTNITGTNRFTTNTTVTTNGNTVVTSNVVTSNMVAITPTNAAGTPIAPVAGATNNLNNLPRAAAPTAGNPSGTQLINQRPLGEAPTPTQSQALHTPTQPGTVTTEAAGAATTGTGTTTGTQTTPQNTTLGPQNTQTTVQAATTQQGVVNSGNTPPTSAPPTGVSTSATGTGGTSASPSPRVLLAPQQHPQPQPAPAPK